MNAVSINEKHITTPEYSLSEVEIRNKINSTGLWFMEEGSLHFCRKEENEITLYTPIEDCEDGRSVCFISRHNKITLTPQITGPTISVFDKTRDVQCGDYTLELDEPISCEILEYIPEFIHREAKVECTNIDLIK